MSLVTNYFWRNVMKKSLVCLVLFGAMTVSFTFGQAGSEAASSSGGLTLSGRTCVIEGGTGFIGREAVLMMAEKGMSVVKGFIDLAETEHGVIVLNNSIGARWDARDINVYNAVLPYIIFRK
jgi:hypothetical protein